MFEFSLGAVLDLTLSFMNDPATQNGSSCSGMLVSSFSIPTVTGGLSAALALLSVVGLAAALAVAVVKQVVDYFRSNPDARAKIGMKIDMIYTVEDLPIVGLFFQFGRFVLTTSGSPSGDVGNAIHRWMSKQGGILRRSYQPASSACGWAWSPSTSSEKLVPAFMGKHLDEAGECRPRASGGVQGLFKVMKDAIGFTFQPLDMLKEIGGGTWGRRATQVMDDLITAAIKGGASPDDAMEIRTSPPQGFTGNTTVEFRALGILGRASFVSMSLAGSVPAIVPVTAQAHQRHDQRLLGCLEGYSGTGQTPRLHRRCDGSVGDPEEDDAVHRGFVEGALRPPRSRWIHRSWPSHGAYGAVRDRLRHHEQNLQAR